MGKNQSFIDYIRTPAENVAPFGVTTALIIAAVIGAIDTVACVALIIAGFAFMKAGHKGTAILLALVNFLIPDLLPVVDEAVGIVVVIGPMYMDYLKSKNNQT